MHACTIIARNYLPYARVLAESFREHNPSARFTALILDGVEDLDEPFDLLSLYEIGIEPDELHRMAMIYDVTELATAVKPWLLRTLLEGGAGAAVYFDPDIAVYAPLDDIGVLAQEHSIVLTPHTTKPYPDDGCRPDYTMIMNAGTYNLGFIGVSERATPFLDWWSERLSRNCLIAFDQAMFVDQRWVDMVPSLFEHYILLDPGCNVAYWNLHGRQVSRSSDEYEVNGMPLRFFHFSGYKPEKPHLLSFHMGAQPRVLLSENPDLARLCGEYGEKLLANGYGRDQLSAYKFNRLPGGIAVDTRMRRLFREELLEAERNGGATPPNPFDPEVTERFIEWLRDPVKEGSTVGISRYAYSLYSERPDLQQAFPDVLGADAPRYVAWLRECGQLPKELLPDERATATRTGVRTEKRLRSLARSHPVLARGRPVWRALKRASVVLTGRRKASGLVAAEAEIPDSMVEVAAQPGAGVNLVGYLSAELGIGEVARKLMSGLDRAEIEFSTITYDRTMSRQEHRVDERSPQQAPFDMNVICVNADQLPNFREDVGTAFFEQRYSVGVWFWEISRFPSIFHNAFRLVDEVWAASSFVRDTLAAATSKPVHVVPLPLEMPSAKPIPRAQIGLPDNFMFLFSFDFLSIFERKNPLGIVDAFTRAFADGEGPILVLKCINGEHDLESLERLRLATAERSDIYLLEEYLAPEMKNALMAGCDCYVSLHRSEGFGLTMAEAMAYGKPVIATNYSGNVDFMHEGNSYLIPYELVPIPGGCDPYPAGAEWADPDIDDATAALRRVFDDQAAARELGERARDDILERFSVDRTAAFLAERFAARAPSSVGSEHDERAWSKEDALAAAHRRLGQGSGSRFVTAGRRRPGVRTARKILRKLLWPYIVDQHELQAMVVEAVTHLQREVEAAGSEARAEAQLVEQRFESTQGQIERAQGQIERAQGQIERAQGQIERLGAELTAAPYVSEPGALRISDEAGRPVVGFRDSKLGAEGGYRGFEDTFRGTEDFIRDRQRPYLDLLGGRSPVLDVGCGRGEFLELLAEADVEARGIDTDPDMVARCREKGLIVEQVDAVSYLEAQPDGSLGVVFSAQVIEHLPYEELTRYFQLAERKLAPSGLFIAETVNPHSIQAFKVFWVDLTHRAPIFPEVAVTLAGLHGFESAYVFFPLGTGELEIDRLTQGEYALVATRAT